MPCVLVVVKREKELLTPDGVVELTSWKHWVGKEEEQAKTHAYI